ncbi:MAG TPA: terminase family protein, partial [Trueperaceae bacterium]
MADAITIRPQPGPQEAFLASSADIVVYGGAAGGGKSYALLLEPLRHITTVPGFGAVIFRRTSVQVRNEGGLWDESEAIYGPAGLKPRESVLEWEHTPTGNTVKFAHLEHEKNVLDWQGAQIALIGFDELTHFEAKQFWYMLSRNRSTC